MIAVFDCGNSGIKTGLFKDRELITSFRLPDDASAGLREFVVRLEQAGDGASSHRNISTALICAVTEAGKAAAGGICTGLGVDPFFIVPAALEGLRHSYKSIEKLGADRICAAAGAGKHFPGKNCIVADFGSALTVDAVDKTGRFLGGTITAGYATLTEALRYKFPKLDVPPPAMPSVFCGTDTRECFGSGIYLTIDGAVRKIINELEIQCFQGEKAVHLACGGDAHYFADSGIFDLLEDNLVLEGAIELFYEFGGNK